MKTISTAVAYIIGIVIAAFLLSILFAYPVKWLWNSTVTELFGFKEIGIWMAWKIALLCSFLFKSTSFSSNKD
jgi:hypothetical protein